VPGGHAGPGSARTACVRRRATTLGDGSYTLMDVAAGPVFVTAPPSDPSQFLPSETLHAAFVVGGLSITADDITVSGRPSDSATYSGADTCTACHSAISTAEHTSAHYRSLTPDASRIIAPELFPSVGGTEVTGVSGKDPQDGTTTVDIYACQNSAGVYSFKFGGAANCTAEDGTLVTVVGTYGGEGDGGLGGAPNVGVWKQRFFAALASVPVTASWTYTEGKDLDRLIIPVQITQSGDGVPKWGGYHGNDWTSRGRTFAKKCSGCHNDGLEITWDASNYITSFAYSDFNIGCEVCHGPGSEHIAEPTATKADKGYGVSSEDGGGNHTWPDGLHGKAHRQQEPMLNASVHGNNPYLEARLLRLPRPPHPVPGAGGPRGDLRG